MTDVSHSEGSEFKLDLLELEAFDTPEESKHKDRVKKYSPYSRTSTAAVPNYPNNCRSGRKEKKSNTSFDSSLHGRAMEDATVCQNLQAY
jgi:hypothetical protein